MTDDGPKITSEVKVKKPKRVEAGKKLAALSKAARERKKLDSQSESKTPIVKYTVIGGLGLLVAVGRCTLHIEHTRRAKVMTLNHMLLLLRKRHLLKVILKVCEI